MKPVNDMTLEGKAVRDCELRYTTSGTAIATVTIPSNKSKKDAQGNWQTTHTSWFKVVCFKELAESFAKDCKKGDWVKARGRVHMVPWKDQEGKFDLELIANEAHVVKEDEPIVELEPDESPLPF